SIAGTRSTATGPKTVSTDFGISASIVAIRHRHLAAGWIGKLAPAPRARIEHDVDRVIGFPRRPGRPRRHAPAAARVGPREEPVRDGRRTARARRRALALDEQVRHGTLGR